MRTLQFEYSFYGNIQYHKRIYTSFFRAEYSRYDLFDEDTTGIEDMMVELGITYKIPDNRINREQNAQKLEKAVLNSKEWYTIYDFIEKYLSICNNLYYSTS